MIHHPFTAAAWVGWTVIGVGSPLVLGISLLIWRKSQKKFQDVAIWHTVGHACACLFFLGIIWGVGLFATDMAVSRHNGAFLSLRLEKAKTQKEIEILVKPFSHRVWNDEPHRVTYQVNTGWIRFFDGEGIYVLYKPDGAVERLKYGS